MNIQDKYKWNPTVLSAMLWARGLPQKAVDLHNDAIEALAIEMGQKGQDKEFDSIWTDVIEMEDRYRELQKELNILKQDVSDIENHSKRKNKKL